MFIPPEVCDLIVAYLDQHDLAVCARASKVFRQAANRVLYHDLIFDKSWRVGLGRQAVWSPIMYRTPTRVRQPSLLYNTLLAKKEHRSLVKSASFLLLGQASESDIDSWAKDMLTLFASFDRPPFVHLTCRLTNYWPLLTKVVKVSSMRVNVERHTQDPPTFYTDLRSAMSVKDIEFLTIADILMWRREDEADQHTSDYLLDRKTAFSDVKTLAIINCPFPDQDLVKLMAWPRCLEALTMQIERPPPRDTHDLPGLELRRQMFKNTLDVHSASLMQLHIEFPKWKMKPEEAMCVQHTFKHFTSLKRLSLPLACLFDDIAYEIKKEDAKQDTGPARAGLDRSPKPAPQDILPQSLELLQIQLVPLIYMEDAPDDWSERDGHRFSTFLAWMRTLADTAHECCPRLRRVAVWHRTAAPEDWLERKFDWLNEVPSLSGNFRKANIEITATEAACAPVFGLGENG